VRRRDRRLKHRPEVAAAQNTSPAAEARGHTSGPVAPPIRRGPSVLRAPGFHQRRTGGRVGNGGDLATRLAEIAPSSGAARFDLVRMVLSERGSGTMGVELAGTPCLSLPEHD
jgi:hypothetical protein